MKPFINICVKQIVKNFIMRFLIIILLFAVLPVTGSNTYNDNQSDDPINFYYSAVDRSLIIDCTDNSNHKILIDVYNLTGGSIFKQEVELYAEKSNLIQLELKPGMYIICITEGGKTKSKKILIK